MKRGDLVTVALQGDLDKPQSVAREKIGMVLGHLDDAAMLAVNRALAVFLGLA